MHYEPRAPGLALPYMAQAGSQAGAFGQSGASSNTAADRHQFGAGSPLAPAEPAIPSGEPGSFGVIGPATVEFSGLQGRAAVELIFLAALGVSIVDTFADCWRYRRLY